MVSPTQAVPEVPAVWGNEYPPHTIACRRYAIMVGSWIMIFGGDFWWGFLVGIFGGVLWWGFVVGFCGGV